MDQLLQAFTSGNRTLVETHFNSAKSKREAGVSHLRQAVNAANQSLQNAQVMLWSVCM